MKWEYRIIEIGGRPDDKRALDLLGQEGWELTAIGGTYGHFAYLKRPLKDSRQ
ncbi:hypothetical protein IVB12_15315 [Bradyrhizobium sp. 179]|uniref:hypothetical protein n=1 Tax=Bradyrhizobium sp. 179 TaxID=2782648 RepID=UPI001FF84B9F|nr:hypothetical protein [Bradyrhizobium sp. 179]MCK1543284.1 hypothetical protein [Bradyrhizobium sp. 179]